jgi:hypothetical protein
VRESALTEDAAKRRIEEIAYSLEWTGRLPL